MSDLDPETLDGVVPAVGAVLTHGGRVLVVRDRSRRAWLVPFGRVEPGESVRETVRRELREEVSVEARVERLAGVYSAPETQVLEHRSGPTVQFVTTFVVCSAVNEPDPEPDGEELDRARFVARDAVELAAPVEGWVRDALAGGEPTLR